jgi:integrase
LRAGYAKQGIRGGARLTGRKRKESTVNRYHAALSSVFRFALKRRWDWLKRNPCRDVERGQEGPGRRRWLSDNERKRLLAACRKSEWPGLYPLVMLALSTGARRSELLTLKWSDVDLHAGRAMPHDTKNGEPRTLPSSDRRRPSRGRRRQPPKRSPRSMDPEANIHRSPSNRRNGSTLTSCAVAFAAPHESIPGHNGTYPAARR